MSWSDDLWSVHFMCMCFFFYLSGLCEGGHPDEGQQEESTAPPSVFGKRCFLFVVYKLIDTCSSGHTVFIFHNKYWRLWVNCIVRHFLSGLFLCPDWAIKSRVSWQDVSECRLPEPVLYWQHREGQRQLLTNWRIRVHLWTFMTMLNTSLMCL